MSTRCGTTTESTHCMKTSAKAVHITTTFSLVEPATLSAVTHVVNN